MYLRHWLRLQYVEQHPSALSRVICTPQVWNAAFVSTAADEEASLTPFTGAVTGLQSFAAKSQQLGLPLILRGRSRRALFDFVLVQLARHLGTPARCPQSTLVSDGDAMAVASLQFDMLNAPSAMAVASLQFDMLNAPSAQERFVTHGGGRSLCKGTARFTKHVSSE